MRLTVQLYVERGEAIAQGKTTFGVYHMPVNDAALATLTDDERTQLAEAIEKRNVLGKGFHIGERKVHDPLVGEASLAAVRTILAARVEAVRQEREGGAQLDAAIAKWVAAHGTESQRERLAAGMLGRDEIMRPIRAELFAPFEGFERFRRMKHGAVCNFRICPCRGGNVSFTMRRATRLDDGRFTIFQRMKAAAPPGATLEIRQHVGRCDRCPCVRKKISVSVALEWHGVPMTLEYALD